MRFEEMARAPAPWQSEDAPERDIVLSCRVRLARNVEGQVFPHLLGEDALRNLRSRILRAAASCPSADPPSSWAMEELEELERRFLLERHLVSQELVATPIGRAVLMSEDESRGLMVNEEDHLRIQAFGSGLQPKETLDIAMRFASELEEHLTFAHSPRLGYLSACPTNLGTGLRASVLLHLPGISLTRDLEKVLHSLKVLNYTVRGFYGEGSGALGELFQVSNSATLGLSGAQIVDDLLHHLRKVISVEREARAVLLEREGTRIEDRVFRAWGILNNARLLTTREAFDLLGDVRLGMSFRLLPGVDETTLRCLLVTIQGAHQEIMAQRSLKPHERDERRADYVRRALAKARKDQE
ncbi:MAG TPA: ATP--guanido phosphotransferase [Candidatus Krumholzibacteria bacterium]|nr:ATP--guanido phosphotransferase [Candidatus Krumholzibacteria bacterium]